MELIAGQYWRHFKIASLGIRPQVAYGPERDVGLTAGPSLAARAVARREPFTIGYTGRVGYDYVEDVAEAFVRGALEAPPGAPVVDLAGPIASVEEIVDVFRRLDPAAGAAIAISGGAIPLASLIVTFVRGIGIRRWNSGGGDHSGNVLRRDGTEVF